MNYIVGYNGKIKLMRLKQCHKPPIFLGMVSLYHLYIYGDDLGMVVYGIVLPTLCQKAYTTFYNNSGYFRPLRKTFPTKSINRK